MPSDTQTETPDAEPDLRSLISQAVDAQEGDKSEVDEAPSSERLRAPDGKFIKADAADAAPEPSEPGDAPAPVKSEADLGQPEAEVAPKADTALEAPPTWKAEAKEAFKGLPVEAQQILLTRHHEMEADYSRKTGEWAAFRRDYEPIARMMAPHKDMMARSGYTPETLISAWMDVEGKLLSGQGIPVVKNIIDSYRIDRQQLARELGLSVPGAGTEQPPAPDGQQPIQLPPELVQQLQKLEQGHNQVTQILTAQQQAAQREAENRVMSTITAFRDAKDASGNPLHPHYDELEADMVAMLGAARASGQEPTLESLYDKAVWANTSTRQKTLEGQRAADEAQRTAAEKKTRDEARAKAERARKAGSSVTGTPGSGQAALNGARTPDSIRAAIDAAIEEHADA